MPNYSSGILYVAGKNPDALANFLSHGMNHNTLDGFPLVDTSYPGTTLEFWNETFDNSLEYLGNGRYVVRVSIECRWSCAGCVLSDVYSSTNRDGLIFMDEAAGIYDVGFVIEAEENGFSEYIVCNNRAQVHYEQPDIHYYTKDEDEHGSDSYCEVKYRWKYGWYVVDNGEIVEDAMRQDAQYFSDVDEAKDLAQSLGADLY